eukprot:15440070-Alexandrium_andersonii.AAC.1
MRPATGPRHPRRQWQSMRMSRPAIRGPTPQRAPSAQQINHHERPLHTVRCICSGPSRRLRGSLCAHHGAHAAPHPISHPRDMRLVAFRSGPTQR